MGMAGLFRYRTCAFVGAEGACKEPTTVTIAISTSSNFKPILPMQWIVQSNGHQVVHLYELSYKNGVHSRLQNLQSRKSSPHSKIKFQTNPSTSAATALIVRKQSIWLKTQVSDTPL